MLIATYQVSLWSLSLCYPKCEKRGACSAPFWRTFSSFFVVCSFGYILLFLVTSSISNVLPWHLPLYSSTTHKTHGARGGKTTQTNTTKHPLEIRKSPDRKSCKQAKSVRYLIFLLKVLFFSWPG